MTAILTVLVLALLAWAVYAAVRRFRKGSSCCGEHETVRKAAVRDRNPSHYPYTVEAEVTGMTCENCARRVENALNGLDGVWAKVRIDSRKAVIRCKELPQEAAIRSVVREVGYGLRGWNVRRS